MTKIRHVFFDIGGVLATNGWDREQRKIAIEKFQLDEAEDVQLDVARGFHQRATRAVHVHGQRVGHCRTRTHVERVGGEVHHAAVNGGRVDVDQQVGDADFQVVDADEVDARRGRL